MTFPWQGRPLDQTLTVLRSALTELWKRKPPGVLLPAVLQGASAEEIEVHEKVIGRPIPDPVHRLYQTVGGIQHYGKEQIQTGPTFLRMLQGANWLDPSDHCELLDLPSRWARTDYFAFAQSVAGDTIVHCENPPRGEKGSVILLDHECSNQVMADWQPRWYTPIVYLADSLSDWLSRWVYCGFDELAVSFRNDLPSEIERLYLLDHLRLNPGLEWAEKRLRVLGHPS